VIPGQTDIYDMLGGSTIHLIGINGFKRTGKGAVAKIVHSMYNDGNAHVLGVGFADKVKVYAAKSLGYTGTDRELILLMDEFKENGEITPTLLVGRHSNWASHRGITHDLTGRQYLQHVGNEARKMFGEDFWVDQVLPQPSGYTMANSSIDYKLYDQYRGVDCLCITDLRYKNEARRVKELGGVVWEVLRPGTASDGHDSEQPLPPELIDYHISNDSSLYALGTQVERAMGVTLNAA
jgi:hypothetical protein